MSMDSSPSSMQQQPAHAVAVSAPYSLSADERWAAWQARGEAHQIAVRRKLTVSISIVVFAVAIAYAWLAR